MAINMRLFLVLATIAAAVVVMASSVLAAPGNSGDTKPGWGFGDKNHTHTGPPGQSVSVHP